MGPTAVAAGAAPLTPFGGLRAAPRGRGGATFKEKERSEVHGSGADKCCGYKVTIDHRTLSRCIS